MPISIEKQIDFFPGCKFDIFPMNHSPESIAYKLYFGNKTIAISGDTGWNENIISLANDADILILECNFLHPDEGHHMSFEEIKKNIDRLNCKKIVPIHSIDAFLMEIKKYNHPKIEIVNDGDIFNL